MHKVSVNGKIHFAPDGTILSSILTDESVPHPCGSMGVCRKCLVTVNGKEELSCRYEIHSDIDVVTSEIPSVRSVSGAVTTGRITENMCFALDIGTTTLALALISADTKEIVKVITDTNPQVAYGADVISRIDYCAKNGTSPLQNILIRKINSMTESLGASAEAMFVSGNTTMLHILLGEDCTSMAVSPYTPAFLESRKVSAREIGITDARFIHTLPCISSFVGADITAGINLIDNGKCNLLIDLGTNAEIVLLKDDSFVCTSAAAGPCFEGVNISCGMNATTGAIYSYETGRIKTIENATPAGICGTGLIDVIAFLLKNSVIDENGCMECDEYEIAQGIFITQEDVRQYQVAKSAIRSAIETLTGNENLTFEKIDNIYISGGFSDRINIKNAVATGLLPDDAEGKCIPVNNSSLLGTIKFITEKNDLKTNGKYTDLSSDSAFSDLFIKNMMFRTYG